LQRQGSDGWRLDGELTFATVGSLLKPGETLFADGPGETVIDLSGVQRADSAGVSLLLEWMRQAHRHGNRVVFRHVPEQMRQIARISNLDGILPLAEES